MRYLLLRLLCGITTRPKYPTLGHAEIVKNRDRSFGSARYYVRVPVVREGHREYLLLTKYQYDDARLRAAGNTEDCPALRAPFARLFWPVLYKPLIAAPPVAGEVVPIRILPYPTASTPFIDDNSKN